MADLTSNPSSYQTLLGAYSKGIEEILSQQDGVQPSRTKLTLTLGTWLARYCMTAKMLEQENISENDLLFMRSWLVSQQENVRKMASVRSKGYSGWQGQIVFRMAVLFKTYAEYRSRLWEAARRLFEGGGGGNFTATFARSIDLQLGQAWEEGADSIGVAPEDFTDRDRKVLDGILSNENDFILGIANDIRAAADAGMDPDQFERQFGNRVNVWANRYNDVINQAVLYFGKKERFEWVLGDTEEHCSTCPRLTGIVAWGDEWSRAGLHPQRPPNGKLECGGWNCRCMLNPTKKRRTYGALKKLQAIAGGQ
jgi:hypothetical protein